MNASAARLLRQFSTKAPTAAAAPSKSHLHKPIPDSAFPRGYVVNGVHSGAKKSASALDLAVILSRSHQPAAAAACFTKNAFKAAPVLVSQEVLNANGGRARALVVNSGCANAVTGKQGLDDAWAMVKETDALLESPPLQQAKNETLVMSTGVIGQKLPISKILQAIRAQGEEGALSSGFEAWERAARAFMTTDTFPKLRARKFTIHEREYRIAGIDKGAGMIHPDMGPPSSSPSSLHATLLACLLTDAPVSPPALQRALTYAINRSFNSISVDGDMSTNDTVILLANGAAGGNVIDEGDVEGFKIFQETLTSFAIDLAQLVVRDGEGATKFVTVTVEGAKTYEDAHAIASSISTSALVKTALFGEDANWGRILAATGSVPLSAPLDPTRVSVSFIPSASASHGNLTPLPVLTNGEPENVDEERASQILKEEEFEVKVVLGNGEGERAQYWTCDFSYEYVKINGDYRS